MLDFLKTIEIDDEIKTQIAQNVQALVDNEVSALKLKNDELLQEKRKISKEKKRKRLNRQDLMQNKRQRKTATLNICLKARKPKPTN